MNICPVCSYDEFEETKLSTSQFNLTLIKCKSCCTLFSEEHGKVEVVSRNFNNSFLDPKTEPVESDDYNFRSKSC